jgi:hypothetical protein
MLKRCRSFVNRLSLGLVEPFSTWAAVLLPSLPNEILWIMPPHGRFEPLDHDWALEELTNGERCLGRSGEELVIDKRRARVCQPNLTLFDTQFVSLRRTFRQVKLEHVKSDLDVRQ